MRKSNSLVATLFGVAALTASPAFAGTARFAGHELAGEAKITMDQARAIALKAHAGKITDEELEKEKGGSGLRYSFDIRRGKIIQEVGVDAVTGKVLENAPEAPGAD